MRVASSRKSLQASFPLAHPETSPEAEAMKVPWGDPRNTASRQEAGEKGSQVLKSEED